MGRWSAHWNDVYERLQERRKPEDILHSVDLWKVETNSAQAVYLAAIADALESIDKRLATDITYKWELT